MKKEFKKPIGEKKTLGEMPTIDMANPKEEKSKFVTLDGFVDTAKSNNFPKHVTGRKPMQTGDVISQLVRRCDSFIAAGKNNEAVPSGRDRKQVNETVTLSLADFSAMSLSRSFNSIKKLIKSYKSVKDIKIVNNSRTNRSYIVAILNLQNIVRDDLISPLHQDLYSRIDMEKIDQNLINLKSDDYDYLVVVSEEEVGIALDIRRLLLMILKPSISTSSRLSDTIALSDVEIKGDKLIFAIRSLIAGSERYQDTITVAPEEIVCVNMSLTEERFRKLVQDKMSSISSTFMNVKVVRTVDIINSMMIPTKEINYLLGISNQTSVNYAPLLEISAKPYQKESKVDNMFLQSLSNNCGTKVYSKESIYKTFAEVLDKDLVHISKVGMNDERIYLLPNLRKLAAFVLFDSKVDTTHFKSSVTTTMNTISFVFIV